MAGDPSVQTAHKFFHSIPCSSKKSDTTLKISIAVVVVSKSLHNKNSVFISSF
jgi:hypothetical protein